MKVSFSSVSGFCVLGIAQVVLIVLKLLRKIECKWWKVFLPTYFSVGIVIFAILLFLIFDWKSGDFFDEK